MARRQLGRAAGAGHPRARPVETPAGTFPSATVAAAHGIAVPVACRRARLEREGWRYLDGKTGRWPASSRPRHRAARPVKRPKGVFPSNALAVESCGLNHNAAGKRAARGICGWRFRHGRGRSPNTEPYGNTE